MNTIKNMPLTMRPYEKFKMIGAEKLQDEELLAIILRSGTKGRSSIELAKELLNLSNVQKGLLGLQHLTVAELMDLPGIGEVKAIQIKCICELSKRIAKSNSFHLLEFDRPDTIADYYMEELRHEEQESLICMMLDTKNHFLGDILISKGTVNASLVSPREIFLAALSYHAVNIILIHNHPSGVSTPSEEDLLITNRIQQIGYMLGIILLDHIIIGDLTYCSLRQEGMMQT